MSLKTRPGEIKDVLKTLPLVKKFYDSSFSNLGFTWNEEDVVALMTELAEKHISVVAENERGEIVGVIAGLITPFILNSKILVFQEFIWYVHTDCRGIGPDLMKECFNLARGRGAQKAVMCSVCGPMEHVVERHYERNGLQRFETHYVCDL